MARIVQGAGMPSRHSGGRFATLDGLRGAAALAVVLFHAGDLSPTPFPLGFLAVDLFFVLSGFVMAEVYGPRLDAGMGLWQFLRIRLIRLYPLYLVGAVVGIAVAALVASFRGEPLGWAAPFALLMLPAPGPPTAYLFPTNIPAWSLFAELVVNAVFGAVAWRWSSRTIALIVAALGFGVALTFTGNGEAGATVDTMHVGLLRAGYGFGAGMLIHRVWARERRTATSDWALALPVALLGLLMLPGSGTLALGLMLVAMPAVVVIGVHLEPHHRGLMLAAGAMSYALYCIHVPLENVVRFVAIRCAAPTAVMTVGIVAIVAIAVLLDRFYDPAARKQLISGRC